MVWCLSRLFSSRRFRAAAARVEPLILVGSSDFGDSCFPSPEPSPLPEELLPEERPFLFLSLRLLESCLFESCLVSFLSPD